MSFIVIQEQEPLKDCLQALTLFSFLFGIDQKLQAQ